MGSSILLLSLATISSRSFMSVTRRTGYGFSCDPAKEAVSCITCRKNCVAVLQIDPHIIVYLKGSMQRNNISRGCSNGTVPVA